MAGAPSSTAEQRTLYLEGGRFDSPGAHEVAIRFASRRPCIIPTRSTAVDRRSSYDAVNRRHAGADRDRGGHLAHPRRAHGASGHSRRGVRARPRRRDRTRCPWPGSPPRHHRRPVRHGAVVSDVPRWSRARYPAHPWTFPAAGGHRMGDLARSGPGHRLDADRDRDGPRRHGDRPGSHHHGPRDAPADTARRRPVRRPFRGPGHGGRQRRRVRAHPGRRGAPRPSQPRERRRFCWPCSSSWPLPRPWSRVGRILLE